jgi:hypothetical protein
MAKGILINEKVAVTHKGYTPDGVPWETPYIYFLTSKHGECRWTSERIDDIIPDVNVGDIIHIRCFLYPKGKIYTARRVTFPALLK